MFIILGESRCLKGFKLKLTATFQMEGVNKPMPFSPCRSSLSSWFSNHFFWNQTLEASLCTVHVGVAAVEAMQLGQAFLCEVHHPATGLHENCRSKVLVSVPSVVGAVSDEAGTQGAFTQCTELLLVLNGLQILFLCPPGTFSSPFLVLAPSLPPSILLFFFWEGSMDLSIMHYMP